MRIATAVDAGGDGGDRVELDAAVEAEVLRLPEKYRAVVVLCYWEGLTHEQAADRLGCPLGTVRSRMARARKLLQRRLQPARAGTGRRRDGRGARFAGRVDRPRPRNPRCPRELDRPTRDAGRGGRLACQTDVSVHRGPGPKSHREHVHDEGEDDRCVCLADQRGCLWLDAGGAQGRARAADNRRAAAQPTAAAKSKAQPPLTIMSEYVVEPPDLLVVEVLEALPGRPISGERLVRPDGKICLGFYGDVYVAGLTLPEVKEKIIRSPADGSWRTKRWVWSRAGPRTGEPVRRSLRPGKPKRIDPKDSDRVFVDVTAYNSKNYYVEGEVAVARTNCRLPDRNGFSTPSAMPVA